MKALVIIGIFCSSLIAWGETKLKDLGEVQGFETYKGNDILYFPKYHKAYNIMINLRKDGFSIDGRQLDCDIASGLSGFGFQDAIVFEKSGYDYLTVLSKNTMVELGCNLSIFE